MNVSQLFQQQIIYLKHTYNIRGAGNVPSKNKGDCMRNIITVLVLSIVVFSMPLAFANNENHQDKTSGLDLRFKQIGQSFQDFVFNVRSALTFDEKTKLELLKERNDVMKERQQAWLEIKAKALAEVNSTDDKKDVIEMIQSEHEALVKEHLRLTSEANDIEVKAKVNGDQKLEKDAKDLGETDSNLSLGLSTDRSGLLLMKHGKENITQAQAEQIVEKYFGFKATSSTVVTENNSTFYVVTATESRIAGSYNLTKYVEIKVDASTGVVVYAKMYATITAVANPVKEDNETDEADKGRLEGVVKIGPICPVERNPPEPRCLATERTYKIWQVAVWNVDKTKVVAELHPKLNGMYKTNLPAGNYTVAFEQNISSSSNLPQNITIHEHETTYLNITVDTGIR
ncbi:MAG: PepSY domain-containing protein [Candidatus Aenigmarchaeota archaeon]|nr:PepSY domain-containing protein [Candidatus Aenigmarchaeota archaeon]